MTTKQDTVKPLADLFTVVIGLSLTIALQGAIDITDPFPLKLAVLPTLVAFLLTILPFAHGAVTHLHATYGDSDAAGTTSVSLIVDYFILFLNGCIFVGWASLLPNREYSTYAYISILLVDCVWGFLASAFAAGHPTKTPTLKWATINFVTAIILLLAVMLFIGPVYAGGWDQKISWAIALLALVRTVVDYSLTWKFYIGRR